MPANDDDDPTRVAHRALHPLELGVGRHTGNGAILFRLPLIAYGTLLLEPAMIFCLYGTSWGPNSRADGESPDAADATGILVAAYRYFATVTASTIIGLSGAYLSASIAPAWTIT
jgi:general nucleoside transport system permease protein